MEPTAQHAIDLLGVVHKELGAAHLAYWTLPNTILTLSGARAFCDGVFWNYAPDGKAEIWHHEITEGLKIIEKNTDILWSETGIVETSTDTRYASYELITAAGLRYVLSQTELVPSATYDPTTNTTYSLQEMQEAFTSALKSNSRVNHHTKENLNHIAFGILLGYPDIAITESTLKWEENDPFAEPLIDADIRGAKYYICPQPIYSYPRQLMTNPAIQAHEKLWSQILRDYYTSDFHKMLEKDKSFMNKMKELDNLA